MRITRGSIYRRLTPFAVALLITAGAQAANVSSTFTLTGSGSFNSSGNLAITGPATMSGVYTGNGQFTSTVSFTSSAPSPFTITVTAGNTLTGNFTLASGALSGTDTGSLTITGGTGTYAGYTGTFSSVKETGSFSLTGSLTLSCTGTGTVNTAGGGTTTPVPNIGAVLDSASDTVNIAQGSMFSVYGTNLTPTSVGLVATFPRPTVVGGVKVTFTPVAGGASTDTYLFYVGKQGGYDQINGILPSTVQPGNYYVTVTNGTVSNQFLTGVVATKVGLFTQDQTGTGLAVVFNYISQSESDVNRLTTGNFNGALSSPARPGQTLVAWGTGIGPYTAGDNGIVTHDFSATQTILAIVGGVSIPVAFAGLNGYAGEDQINFTLPANVPTGCSVPLQISVGGVLSAAVSIAIAPSASATACVQTGYTAAQLQYLDQGGTITAGGFSLSEDVTTVGSAGAQKIDDISGSFTQVTGYQLSSSGTPNYSLTTVGSCQIIKYTFTGSTVTVGGAKSLDAGTVTITGPSGSNLTNQKLTELSTNEYSDLFNYPGEPSTGTILAGTYTLTGTGGTSVGPFNTSITIGPPLSLSSPLPTTVTESAGFTLNWTGGNASDVVNITGVTSTSTGTGANKVYTATGFICTTTAGQKTYTVPPAVLTQLIPANGSLDVSSGVGPVTFNATLKADGSNIPSAFSYSWGTGGTAVFQ